VDACESRPVPLLSETTDLLRAALNEIHERYAEAFDAEMGKLESSETWRKLSEEQRNGILGASGLQKHQKPRLEGGAAVLDALNGVSLSEWENLTLSLPERFGRALAEAARLLEPKAVRVRPPNASLATEDEVDEYLKDLRGRIMGHIDAGRPVTL
jgi:hypothetical protein